MAKTRVHERLLELINVRNILDNGGFEIWQRGAGPFYSNVFVSADRWNHVFNAGGTCQIDQWSVDKISGDYSVKVNVTATSGFYFWQGIENYKEYLNKTISFSAWIKTTSNNVGLSIMKENLIPIKTTYHSGSGSWEYLTVSFLIPDTITSLEVGVTIPNPYLALFYMDNAMLVVGSEPVDYVPTPPAEEWERCQRYYERSPEPINGLYISGYGMSPGFGGTCGIPIIFNVKKRAVPNLTITIAYGSDNVTGVSAASLHTEGFSVLVFPTSTAGWWVYVYYVVEV